MLNNSLSDKSTVAKLNGIREDIDKIYSVIAGYSSSFNTENLGAEKADIDEAKVGSLEANSVKSTTAESEIGSFNSLRAKTANLGNVTVESLQYLGSSDVTANIADAKINKAAIDDLTVNKTLDIQNAVIEALNAIAITAQKANITDTYQLNGKDIASLVGDYLYLGSGVYGVNNVSTVRPKWQSKDLALVSDINGLSFKGVVDNEDSLPKNAEAGDFYIEADNAGYWVYDSTSWKLIYNNPSLSAYRTSADQDVIDKQLQQNIDNAIVSNDEKISTLEEKVDTLSNTVADNDTANTEEHTEIKESVAEVKTTADKNTAAITAIQEDYVTNAPSDGTLYGMKDGEWASVNDNSAFVPKVYSNTTIDNGEDGLSITSDKPMAVPTSKATDPASSVVNREYIHSNLKITKAISNAKKTHKATLIEPPIDRINMDTTAAVSERSWGMTFNRCRTKNYYVQWVQRYPNQAAHTITEGTFYAVKASSGEISQVPQSKISSFRLPVYPNDNASNMTVSGVWVCAFDPETYEDYPEYADYWYAYYGDYHLVEVFNGFDKVGEIDLTSDFWTSTSGNYKQYQMVPARTKPEIMIFSQGIAKAIILGKDTDGNLDPLAVSYAEALPGTPMLRTVSTTSSGWWFLNQTANAKNLMIKLGYDGTPSASVIQNENGEVLAGTTVYQSIDSFLNLTDGRAIHAIQGTFGSDTSITTGFVVIDESADVQVKYLKQSVLYSTDTAGQYGATTNSMFQAGDYVFFIPKIGYAPATVPITPEAWVIVTGGTGPSLTAACNNTFLSINLSSGNILSNAFPWTQTKAVEWYQNDFFKTKGGYYWIFPGNGGQAISSALTVSPTGAIQTVQINSSEAIQWNSSMRVRRYTTEWATYYSPKAILADVNKDGIGAMTSVDGTKLLVFYGNGENAVFDYSAGWTTDGLEKYVGAYSSDGEWRSPLGKANTATSFNGLASFTAVGSSFYVLTYKTNYVNRVTSLEINPDSPLDRPTLSCLELTVDNSLLNDHANNNLTSDLTDAATRAPYYSYVDGVYDDGRCRNIAIQGSAAPFTANSGWASLGQIWTEIDTVDADYHLYDGETLVS